MTIGTLDLPYDLGWSPTCIKYYVLTIKNLKELLKKQTFYLKLYYKLKNPRDFIVRLRSGLHRVTGKLVEGNSKPM